MFVPDTHARKSDVRAGLALDDCRVPPAPNLPPSMLARCDLFATYCSRGRGGRLLVMALFGCFAAAASAADQRPAPGAAGSRSQPLDARIAAELSKLPHKQTVASAAIIDLDTGREVYLLHPTEPLIPASNMKVFTMAAALAVLGADFSFRTTLAMDNANLYLVGDGDPGLGDPRLAADRKEGIAAAYERWAKLLAEANVSVIPGDLVVDASIFDEQLIHPAWDAEDLGKWYAAPVAGLNFNDNCVDITVTPARHGRLASVSVLPACDVVQVVNKCVNGGKGDPVLNHTAGTTEYVITGSCRKKWPFGAVAFPDPPLLAADALRTVLKQHGITVSGTIREQRVRTRDGQLPEQLLVLAEHHTPLADVLGRTGKNSQNLFAECLLKRIGYEWALRRGDTGTMRGDELTAADGGDAPVGAPTGTWANGSAAVLDVLRQAGVDTAGLVVSDGSGLSRENRCTARQLTAALAWMDRGPHAELFWDSLSEAGVDGSLHKRLTDLAGSVYAKTGTMRGVRTLSGYVTSRSGRRYAFAILFNNYPGSSAPYKEIQDRICRLLATSDG